MVVLASKSPRRITLLKEIYKDFLIVPSNIDEYLYPMERISLEKAKAVCPLYPDDIIISADTLVIKDGKVYGKPHNYDEAFAMLKELSGKKHSVITYYSIVVKNKNIYFTSCCESLVYFSALNDEFINSYIESGSPFDKAGGYGIQDSSFHLIDRIEGSYNNIVGLPVEELKSDLKKLNLL